MRETESLETLIPTTGFYKFLIFLISPWRIRTTLARIPRASVERVYPYSRVIRDTCTHAGKIAAATAGAVGIGDCLR